MSSFRGEFWPFRVWAKGSPRSGGFLFRTSPLMIRPAQLVALVVASLSLAVHAQTPVGPPAKIPTVDEEIQKAALEATLRMEFHGATPADLSTWQKEFSAKLNTLIGPHIPPQHWHATLLSTKDLGDHVREELLLEADRTPTLPLYVLYPKNEHAAARYPIVLCLHGHGPFGNDAVAGVDDTPEKRAEIESLHYDYGRQLARQGYLAIVPCFTPFGRRLGPVKKGATAGDPCATEFVRLMYLGKTLLGENLRDVQWALDYAVQRPDAIADRIGCVGLSYGGRMTMMVTALDPRVRVAVISGAMNVFQERIQNSHYSCGAQVIPGLLEFGDTPEIGSLIAPRPAIWEAGLQDRLMAPGWLEKAQERLQRAYSAAGHPENFQVHRFNGDHQWNGETALPLLNKVLKGE